MQQTFQSETSWHSNLGGKKSVTILLIPGSFSMISFVFVAIIKTKLFSRQWNEYFVHIWQCIILGDIGNIDIFLMYPKIINYIDK